MAEFHETVGGRKFYDADVPRMVKALEGLQKAVEQLAKAAQPVAPAPAPNRVHGQQGEGGAMTHAEYEQKRIAVIRAYMSLAVVRRLDEAGCDDLARQLTQSLDRLALEIDPFENIIKRRETR